MNRREIVLISIGAVIFLAVLFYFYLPRQEELKALNATIVVKRGEIERLGHFIPDRPLEEGRLKELIEESEGLQAAMERECDISLAPGELVRLCRVTGGITIDSITEVGAEAANEEGLEKRLIKLHLRASFHDFARLLHGLNDSGLSLAVNSFTIDNEENRPPLSRIELTVAACVFREESKSDGEEKRVRLKEVP